MIAGVKFPGEDQGRSLAEMAHRDLDAALQLLADRAQYITGATGAAIALRRDGKNDMLCRASTGSNAPELGALLSTEFGLSGESVRTRRALRCDDAERDARVNRDVCRQLGIASVVVMPVVNDDEVLGVFELFSGQANAFGERDLTAVQRLTEMVETAVKLAHATGTLTERLRTGTGDAAIEAAPAEDEDSEVILDELFEGPEASTAPVAASTGEVPASVETPEKRIEGVESEPVIGEVVAEGVEVEAVDSTQPEATAAVGNEPAVTVESGPSIEEAASAAPVETKAEEVAAPKKRLFWSAALTAASEAEKAEGDQSHVPPVLRGLSKCSACGFPISGGRVLCVECEEKKWRGQLPRPQARAVAVETTTKPQAFAAAAHATASAALPMRGAASPANVEAPKSVTPEPAKAAALASEPVPAAALESAAPEVVFSGGLEPTQSWLGRNKYVVGVLLIVAAAVAAFLTLR